MHIRCTDATDRRQTYTSASSASLTFHQSIRKFARLSLAALLLLTAHLVTWPMAVSTPPRPTHGGSCACTADAPWPSVLQAGRTGPILARRPLKPAPPITVHLRRRRLHPAARRSLRVVLSLSHRSSKLARRIRPHACPLPAQRGSLSHAPSHSPPGLPSTALLPEGGSA